MSEAAVVQDRHVRFAWLSNPTLLLCVAGIALPNLLTLGALITDIGTPPRTAAIAAYAALALVARSASPYGIVPAYLAIVVYDVISTVAASFNLMTIDIGFALSLAGELRLFETPFYLALFAGLALLVALNLGFMLRNRDAFRRGNIFALIGLTAAFAAVDILANASPHYQFGAFYGANKKMESASAESGFRDTVLTKAPRNALVVMVEALGTLDDPAKQTLVLEPFHDTDLLKRYDVSFGSTTYYGSTTAAEMRELCDTRKPYQDLIADESLVCLPKMLQERGYRTLSLHNFTSAFFDRLDWYPKMGIGRSIFGQDLEELKLRPCGVAFRGPCDVELVPLVAKHLREAASPTFFYWLTLTTHVPVVPGDAAARLGCQVRGGPVGHAEVCYMVELWVELFEAIARMTANVPPTEILIVGDHAPPLWSKAGRAQFTPGKVPWIRLTPRAENLTAAR